MLYSSTDELPFLKGYVSCLLASSLLHFLFHLDGAMAHRPASGDACWVSLGNVVKARADLDVQACPNLTGKPSTNEGWHLAGDGLKPLSTGQPGSRVLLDLGDIGPEWLGDLSVTHSSLVGVLGTTPLASGLPVPCSSRRGIKTEHAVTRIPVECSDQEAASCCPTLSPQFTSLLFFPLLLLLIHVFELL